jgi:ABC-type antimicrobial peptide transport system permease subunit
MVWAYQNYRYGFSFDKFHPDIDHIYRGLSIRQGADGVHGLFPMPAVKLAKAEFPQISEVNRINKSFVNVQYQKDETFAEMVLFTDPSFFNFFNFPLIKGNHDLANRSSVFITERVAKKYFGSEDPLGKTLMFYAGENYSYLLTVTGLLKDPPMNSSIQFDILTNFKNMVLENGKAISEDDWSLFLNIAAYFKIPNPTDVGLVENGLKRFLPLQNKARQDWKASGFSLINIRKNAELNSVIRSDSLFERPSDPAIYGPLVTALLIMLCACLNFSNTTVSRANRRLKEIGVRKVMGGTHIQLIAQMLLECLCLVLAGILLSVLINFWWLPKFNEMFQYVDVEAHYLQDPRLLGFLFVMLILTTLLAGAYPAFYISSFNPSSIFRGSIKFGGSNLFSRIMLGMQIAISIMALVGGFAFAKNAAFQNKFDFGYDLHSTIGCFMKDGAHYRALKNELSKLPATTGIAGTRDHLGFSRRHEISESEGVKKETMFLEVGSGYLSLMNMKLVVGRGFSDSLESEIGRSLLVTEKYASLFGWKPNEALHKTVRIDTAVCTIVGVLKDFHPATLFEPTEPVALRLVGENNYHGLVAQSQTRDLKNLYMQTENAWKKLFPTEPFAGFYQDQVIAQSYQVSSSIASIFSWLAVVAMLMSAAGLFALVSLTLIKRMREIALRTVVGASPLDIFLLVGKGFLWVLIAGLVLGTYAGWSMTKSLLDQIFRVNVGISTFTILASIIIVMLTILIVSGTRICRALQSKIIDLLRTE